MMTTTTRVKHPSEEQSEKTPAIAMLDCGAATTNLVIVSGETHWSWTGELGGEDLTTALARVTKLTHCRGRTTQTQSSGN